MYNNVIEKFTYKRRLSPNQIEESPISSSTKLILSEAIKLGIEVEAIKYTRVFKLSYKGKFKYFHSQIPSESSPVSIYACNHKYTTKMMLREAGVSVPRGFKVRPEDSEEALSKIFTSLEKPLVIKPNTGTHGNLVTTDISTKVEFLDVLDATFSQMSKTRKTLLIEEMLVDWKEFRILATSEKVIGITHRDPANIIGNGVNTIQELIQLKNKDPRRKDPESHPPLFKIIVDKKMQRFLAKQDLSLDFIPAPGQKVYLRQVSNISQGADSIDFTDTAHPSVKQIAIKAIRSLPGLAMGGIDFMCKDITTDQTNDSYAIIEINDSPGIDIHDYPYIGDNRKAGVEFIKIMFPEIQI